nr:DNA-directed DNA polymerase [Tanacetum cinerariifolium]
LAEVGKFTFPAGFVILEMEEDSKVPLILGRPFLHTADAVIRVKHKQLNLEVGTERMIFNIDAAMKHSYSNGDTCFSIDVINEILEEDFDALLDEGSKILHSIEGTLLEEEIFSEFDEFMGMTTYLKELISNKHKIEQISAAFLSVESSAMIQNKVSPKLRDPESFLIPCNFNKTFSCNALADLGARINLMSYSLYVKLSLETLKPTKISVRLADRSFQYPVGIAEIMLVKVGKFTFPANFVILEMEEDSKAPLILGRPFLYIADAVIRVKQKQLNLGQNPPFHRRNPYRRRNFSEFNEFIAMAEDENSESESGIKEPPFEKITINTIYKMKTSLEEPSMDLELKPLPDNLEYIFLEEPCFLPVIISSKLSAQNKRKLIFVLK